MTAIRTFVTETRGLRIPEHVWRQAHYGDRTEDDGLRALYAKIDGMQRGDALLIVCTRGKMVCMGRPKPAASEPAPAQ